MKLTKKEQTDPLYLANRICKEIAGQVMINTLLNAFAMATGMTIAEAERADSRNEGRADEALEYSKELARDTYDKIKKIENRKKNLS